jgi:hypothetical protein
MHMRAYPTLTTRLQALIVLAAVPATTPWGVPRAGSGRTAGGARTVTRPAVDGRETRGVPESRRLPALSDAAPPGPLACGILVGDELRLHAARGPRGGTSRAFLSV